ncbi:NAD(P)-binding domain-containing protein [Acuticoccus kandeliae]|uniref:NAD(P)-binding domain-containing protein n=1 Tax=Acuticoccus kandeliae TaxID=2073160 RepID=UPI000D3E9C00|nr:NAD(P)-binding domain-containing protein [Acuticoccus kandeliae]
MRRTEVAVIGGGQAGLAISMWLSASGIDHIILERGRVAERWRTARWDSLRLLTPNWMTRLPGHRYTGPDPDGFMTMAEVAAFFEAYAAKMDAPLMCGTEVRAVRQTGGGFQLSTSAEPIAARAVVIATGECGVPYIPPLAWMVPEHIAQVTPARYRSPASIGPGDVLVVGASASGIQIADELRRAGRRVTIAVGNHVRLPRRYRGQDIMWWLDRTGILDETVDASRDIAAARRQPSFQLVGSAEGRTLDLARLAEAGVQLAGRFVGIDGNRAMMSDDLADTIAEADARLVRLLDRIDGKMRVAGLDDRADARDPIDPIQVDRVPHSLDLRRFGTIVWATGYRRAYPWLRVPVFDRDAEIIQSAGITAVPGLYTLGMRFQRSRKSSFIDGVGADAAALLQPMTHHLARQWRLSA